jgi:hypothetical protein
MRTRWVIPSPAADDIVATDVWPGELAQLLVSLPLQLW